MCVSSFSVGWICQKIYERILMKFCGWLVMVQGGTVPVWVATRSLLSVVDD